MEQTDRGSTRALSSRSQAAVQVAGLAVRLVSHQFTWQPRPRDLRQRFLVAREADVTIRWNTGRIDPSVLGTLVLNATPHGWTMYRRGEKHVVHCHPRTSGLAPFGERWAVFAPDFDEGEVLVASQSMGETPFYPLELPLDYILCSGYLNSRRGLLLHGCGIAIGDRGLLCTGPSGAGKTTLARLWARQADATVLSDDLVFVREIDGQFWLYGTPWGTHSSDLSSPGGTPLAGVCLVKHAPTNSLSALPPIETIARLFAQTFSPCFFDPDDVGRGLDLCVDICRQVPVRELGFVPDERVLDLLRRET
jgi:hypothetical protein